MKKFRNISISFFVILIIRILTYKYIGVGFAGGLGKLDWIDIYEILPANCLIALGLSFILSYLNGDWIKKKENDN